MPLLLRFNIALHCYLCVCLSLYVVGLVVEQTNDQVTLFTVFDEQFSNIFQPKYCDVLYDNFGNFERKILVTFSRVLHSKSVLTRTLIRTKIKLIN